MFSYIFNYYSIYVRRSAANLKILLLNILFTFGYYYCLKEAFEVTYN